MSLNYIVVDERAGRSPVSPSPDNFGYVGISHTNRKTKAPTGYSRTPSLNFKGNWLKEAGFETGRGVTVKISQGCIVLMADGDEVQELREQLYHEQQVVKGIKDGMFSVLNES